MLRRRQQHGGAAAGGWCRAPGAHAGGIAAYSLRHALMRHANLLPSCNIHECSCASLAHSCKLTADVTFARLLHSSSPMHVFT